MNPLFTALGVGVGTMVAMGGSTIVVSGLGMAVAKRVMKARIMKTGTACPQCQGEGFVSCDICQGTCIVRCRTPKSMTQILKESRGAHADVTEPATFCSCPACGTSGWQRCLNCLGDTKW